MKNGNGIEEGLTKKEDEMSEVKAAMAGSEAAALMLSLRNRKRGLDYICERAVVLAIVAAHHALDAIGRS